MNKVCKTLKFSTDFQAVIFESASFVYVGLEKEKVASYAE
jgi:hypothetical protein